MHRSQVVAAAAAPHSLDISPAAVGGGILVVLLIMLFGLLVFGKGREHS